MKVPRHVTTDNRAYWARRALMLKANSLQSTEEYERELYKHLDSLERSFELELKRWYGRYAANEGISPELAEKLLKGIDTKNFANTLSQFEKKAREGGHDQELNSEYYKMQIARLQALQAQLSDKFGIEGDEETERMRKALKDNFENTYNRANYNIQQQKGYFTNDFAHFSDQMAQAVLSQGWGSDGKVFSQRIWKNYRETLPSQLTDSLLRSTLRGDSYAKVVNDFRGRYEDVKKAHVHRLVVTEMGHVAETATGMAYDEEEVEMYEYMATLERRTCDICGKLDGRKYKVSNRKPGLNYPLIHPWCRCTTVPYISMKPASRYDQENAQRVRNMTYKTWKDKVDAGTIEAYKEPKRRKPKATPPAPPKPPKKAPVPPAVKQPEPVKPPADSFAKFRPTPETSIDIDNAPLADVSQYLSDNFGMFPEINGKTNFTDFSIREAARTFGSFKKLFKAMPQDIPRLIATSPGRSRGAVAMYSFYRAGGRSVRTIPHGFAMNMEYFVDEATLTREVGKMVDSKWLSNNRDRNHILVHESGHHFAHQLTNLDEAGGMFETKIFKELLKDDDFKIDDISNYAAQYHNNKPRSPKRYVEPFAEMFAEAYGPTPRPMALKFKEEFEKQAMEVLRDAGRA